MRPSLFVTSMIDRPARDALARAHAGVPSMLGPVTLGLGLAAATTALGLALGGHRELIEAVLRAMVEAVMVAVPVVVAATTLTLKMLSPPSTLSSLSVSMGIGGLCAALVIPLLAFLNLCAPDGGVAGTLGHTAVLMELLMAPCTFLLATSVALARVFEAFDRRRGIRLAWLFAALAFTTFLLRLSPTLSRI